MQHDFTLIYFNVCYVQTFLYNTETIIYLDMPFICLYLYLYVDSLNDNIIFTIHLYYSCK